MSSSPKASCQDSPEWNKGTPFTHWHSEQAAERLLPPQLTQTPKLQVLTNPKKMCAKQECLLVWCSSSIFWSLLSISRCYADLHFALDLRHVIWDYGKRTDKSWAQSEALPVTWTVEIVLQPHTHSWQSSVLNRPCLHLCERIHRACRLLNMDDKITFIPQQYQSKSLHHPLNSMLNDLNEAFFFFHFHFLISVMAHE